MTKFTAVIQKEEEMYIASCPEIGTTSQGKTVEESLQNLKEATEVYLEEFPQEKKSDLILATFEVAESVQT